MPIRKARSAKLVLTCQAGVPGRSSREAKIVSNHRRPSNYSISPTCDPLEQRLYPASSTIDTDLARSPHISRGFRDMGVSTDLATSPTTSKLSDIFIFVALRSVAYWISILLHSKEYLYNQALPLQTTLCPRGQEKRSPTGVAATQSPLHYSAND